MADPSPRMYNILGKATALKLPIKKVPNVGDISSKATLWKHSKDVNHQGVVLRCSTKTHIPVKSLQELKNFCQKTEGITGVFLERITDPHNLGAILRSCYFFGVDFVVVDHVNRCPLTSTVSRTSAGALELMDVYSSATPEKLLSSAVDQKWAVLATVSPKVEPQGNISSKTKDWTGNQDANSRHSDQRQVKISEHQEHHNLFRF